MHAETQGVAAGRRFAWITLLVAASVAFSLGFACAAPLAAFAAAAVLTMTKRDAVALVVLVWLSNQIVGFALLGYPLTFETFAWGGVLGLVALLCVLGAQSGARLARGAPWLQAAGAAFLLAFAFYEGSLYAASLIAASGLENYDAPTIARIFAINAAAFIGLLALDRLGVAAPAALRARPVGRVR